MFYRQLRIGKNRKTFRLFKFATMLRNSPNMTNGTITVKNDPRVLPLGRFLRKSKINELPQLINVLIGDISLIGPRPLTEETFGYYNKLDKEIISSVKPGLSGVGSIIFRSEEDLLKDASSSVTAYKEQIAPYKAELEKWFVRKNGVPLYFALLLLTVHAVLVPRSDLIWRVFKDLPVPPDSLLDFLTPGRK